MGDYGYYDSEDDRVREQLAKYRLDDLRNGYAHDRFKNLDYCLRCGCCVVDKQIHNTVCPWNQEMLQAGLEKLSEV